MGQMSPMYIDKKSLCVLCALCELCGWIRSSSFGRQRLIVTIDRALAWKPVPQKYRSSGLLRPDASAAGSEGLPCGALPGPGALGRYPKSARCAPVSPLLPRPDRTLRGPLADAGPRGRAAADCGGGGQSQLRRYYYQQRLYRWAGARD